MYKRAFNLTTLAEQRSLFLFGPRQTGKSTLLQAIFPKARYVNLLEADTFRTLSAHPEELRQTLRSDEKLIILDEVQKLPLMLDEVQTLIDRDKSLRFILTGSSARKLKRGKANLLGGRAWSCRLHPLISQELQFQRLIDRLNYGSLPSIIDSSSPQQDLKAYVGLYLQEEIQAEATVRSIENFSRFIEVAALTNGQQLDFTAVGNDAQVPPRTIREYYKILEDTLIGYQLAPFQKTMKRKSVATSKFYFFDVGVANVLMKRGTVEPHSKAYGETLEHQIFLELRAYLDYRRRDEELTYWRTHSKFEVDFLVGDKLAIEVKSTRHVSTADTKSLLALSEEIKLKKRIVVANESRERTLDSGIQILPIEAFLRQLWNDELV